MTNISSENYYQSYLIRFSLTSLMKDNSKLNLIENS
jgi:hypothetical protein